MRRLMFVIIAMLGGNLFSLQAQIYEELWKQVENFRQKDLPKSVETTARLLFQRAEKEHNKPQQIKAYITLMEARAQISPDSCETDANYLTQWANTESDSVAAAVLHCAAGDAIYRSQPREAAEHWRRALQPKRALEASPVTAYAPLLEKGKTSLRYNDDRMYPVVARRVLQSLNRNSRLLDDAEQTEMAIYDSLLTYYERKGQRESYVLAAVEKYNRLLEIENNREQLQEQLTSLITRYGEVETCAEAYLSAAENLRALSRKQEAYALLQEGVNRYPRYVRINALKNLMELLARPDVNLRVNTLYPGREEQLTVSYTNASAFKLQIYTTQVTDIAKVTEYNQNDDFWKGKWKILRTEHYTLPIADDYDSHTTTVPLQLDKEGYYLLKTVPVGNYTGTVDASHTLVCVSSLGVVLGDKYHTKQSAIVVDRMTGHPIPNATIQLYGAKGRGTVQSVGEYPVNGKGIAEWTDNRKNGTYNRWYIRAVAPGHTHAPLQNCWISDKYDNGSETKKEQQRISLFTDRTLYRPGQTVYVSAILYGALSDSLYTLPDRSVKLTLTDVNRKPVSEVTLQTNEFGSVHTSFALPSLCLNGSFRITAECGDRRLSTLVIRVEEYKRPQFEVKLEPVTTPYRLGDTLQIEGRAEMFTGVPVRHATVKYSVTRQERIWRQRETPLRQEGTVQTDSVGRFAFPVILERAKQSNIAFGGGCYFTYEVEVTTEAGDTQQASGTLSASDKYYHMAFDMERSNLWIKETNPSFRILLQNAGLKPVDRPVRYEVYPRRLQQVNGKDTLVTGERLLTDTVRSNRPVMSEAICRFPSGNYRLLIAMEDEYAQLSDTIDFTLISLEDKALPKGCTTDLFYVSNRSFDGMTPVVYIGTSKKNVTLFRTCYTERGELLCDTFRLSDNLRSFSIPCEARYGKGLSLHFSYVKEGQHHAESTTLTVPDPDRTLRLTWQTFRDRLQPGQQEEWRLQVTDKEGRPVAAELLATLYDASLDKLYARSPWSLRQYTHPFPYYVLTHNYFGNVTRMLYLSYTPRNLICRTLDYHALMLPAGYRARVEVFNMRDVRLSSPNTLYASAKSAGMAGVVQDMATEEVAMESNEELAVEEETVVASPSLPEPAPASLRSEFAETAFFYPQLRTNAQGEVSLAFTLPESLTSWRFMGLAYTRDMLSGSLDTTVVARKEFMLQASLPRFVRVCDRVTLKATLTNNTETSVKGNVRLELFNPMTEQVVTTQRQKFTIPADGSTVVSFLCDITDEHALLACRMVAEGKGFSDGEQHLLPVMNRKEWVTESLTVHMADSGTCETDLTALFNHQSPTATNRRFTVELTGNPAWLAILALPSIATPDNDNAYTLAAAYYGSSLSAWIVNRYPRLRTMFDLWRTQGGDKETFLSELRKNEELKSLLLEATPFLTEAESEAEQRRRIATLFDLNTLQQRQALYLQKLEGLQMEDGGWSWYKGMTSSRYMTQEIMKVLLRLQWLTGGLDNNAKAMVTRGWSYLDKLAVEEYDALRNLKKEEQQLSEYAAQYLYLNMLAGRTPTGDAKAAYRFFTERLKGASTRLTISGKAAEAMVLANVGSVNESRELMQSLAEYSVYTPEMGRYYDTSKALYSWSDYRIPTQCMVIEAFQRLGGDTYKGYLPQLQQWLLKQKQVQSWDTPIGTVNAIYALLLDNKVILDEQPQPMLLLDNDPIATDNAVDGLNYTKESRTLKQGEAAPKRLSVRKESQGVAWGSVYAQYMEEVDRLSAWTEGLTIHRELFVERIVDGKATWQPVDESTPLQVGDKVLCRLQLKADRDMDFIQVKEQRAACMEPASVLSGYRFRNGTGYYQAVKDATVEYYIDTLRKGKHTLESLYYITAEGRYEAGLVQVQSVYAPAFRARTDSCTLTVE